MWLAAIAGQGLSPFDGIWLAVLARQGLAVETGCGQQP